MAIVPSAHHQDPDLAFRGYRLRCVKYIRDRCETKFRSQAVTSTSLFDNTSGTDSLTFGILTPLFCALQMEVTENR